MRMVLVQRFMKGVQKRRAVDLPGGAGESTTNR